MGTIELEINEDLGNVEFTLVRDEEDLKIKMLIEEPYSHSQEKWRDFRQAIIDGTGYRLCFCTCNNTVILSHQPNGEIVYQVATGGYGGDGRIIVSLSREICGETMIRLLNRIIDSRIWDQLVLEE